MGNSPHYFIAIHLPEKLQDVFASWQGNLREKLPYKQWYHKKDLHITLKFLGAVENKKLNELSSNLTKVENHSPFTVSVGSIGTFGNPKSPRVLWSGVEKTSALTDVYQEVESVTMDAGFSKENREYRPHITLAKKWIGNRGESYEDELESLKYEFTEKMTLLVHEVTLFQIHPNRKQKYEPVQIYRLG